MTITTEDLRKLLDGVRAPETSLSVSFQIAACRNKLEGASESLAAELITARAKIEAAENLAEAARPIADAAEECDEYRFDDQNQAPVDAGQCRELREALAAWESLK